MEPQRCSLLYKSFACIGFGLFLTWFYILLLTDVVTLPVGGSQIMGAILLVGGLNVNMALIVALPDFAFKMRNATTPAVLLVLSGTVIAVRLTGIDMSSFACGALDFLLGMALSMLASLWGRTSRIFHVGSDDTLMYLGCIASCIFALNALFYEISYLEGYALVVVVVSTSLYLVVANRFEELANSELITRRESQKRDDATLMLFMYLFAIDAVFGLSAGYFLLHWPSLVHALIVGAIPFAFAVFCLFDSAKWNLTNHDVVITIILIVIVTCCVILLPNFNNGLVWSVIAACCLCARIHNLCTIGRRTANYNLSPMLIAARDRLSSGLGIMLGLAGTYLFETQVTPEYVILAALVLATTSTLAILHFFQKRPAPEADDSMISRMSESIRKQCGLSPKETETLFYLIKGLNTAEIAEALFVSPHTVKSHTYSIYKKMEVHSREDLMKVAERFK